MAALLWLWTTLLNGLRLCPHMPNMEKQFLYSFLTISLLDSGFLGPSWLIMGHIFKTRWWWKSEKLGFCHDNSTPYYPQDNGQVEVINKVVKTMLKRMVGQAKSNWNLQLFYALWGYRTTVKNSTGFTPFQLVYRRESMLTQKSLNELYMTHTTQRHLCHYRLLTPTPLQRLKNMKRA